MNKFYKFKFIKIKNEKNAFLKPNKNKKKSIIARPFFLKEKHLNVKKLLKKI